MDAKAWVDLVTGIAWPFVVLVIAGWVLIRYRAEIGGFLHRMTGWNVGGVGMTAEAQSVLAGGFKLELAQSTEELQQTVRDVTEDSDDEEQRRERIEAVIREAAEWGWRRALVSEDEPPEPEVSWTDDGPVIRDPVENSEVERAVQNFVITARAHHGQAQKPFAGFAPGVKPFIMPKLDIPNIGKDIIPRVKYDIWTNTFYTEPPKRRRRDDDDDDPPAGVPAKPRA